jgi:hypothetical protein
MSDGLYSTRLRWSGGPAGCGVARLHGVSVPLWTPPVIGGVPVHDIDYAPEIHLWQVRRASFGRIDDLTPAEVADADAILRAAHQVPVS